MIIVNSEIFVGNLKCKCWLLILFVVIVFVILVSVVWEFFYGCWYEDIDDVYINGNVVQIILQIVGIVVSIGVDDGDLVCKGQELVRFDFSDVDIVFQCVEVNLVYIVCQVCGLFSNVDGYCVEVVICKVVLVKVEVDYKWCKNFVDDGVIFQEELVYVCDVLDSVKVLLISLEQQLNINCVLVDDIQIILYLDVKVVVV